jgi:TetR/AcrR family transcriptional regulator, cholesterol catabolism regulator
MEPLLDEARQLTAPDPVDFLRDLVRLWVGHVVHHREHMVVFQQERHQIEEGSQWRAIRAGRKAFESMLDDALAGLERGGRARYEDRRIALAALLGMVNHVPEWYRPRGRLTPVDIADGFTALMLN